jgi:hypothetical protein
LGYTLGAFKKTHLVALFLNDDATIIWLVRISLETLLFSRHWEMTAAAFSETILVLWIINDDTALWAYIHTYKKKRGQVLELRNFIVFQGPMLWFFLIGRTIWRKNSRFFVQTKSNFAENCDHNIGSSTQTFVESIVLTLLTLCVFEKNKCFPKKSLKKII